MAAGIADERGDSVYVVSATSGSVWQNWLSWTYAGVDPKLPGNGGPECLEFISPSQKLIETTFYVMIAVFAIIYAWPRLNVSDCKRVSIHAAAVDSVGRRVMLLIMCTTFGVEIGFKLATRQLIWILNPCHLVTMMQVCMAYQVYDEIIVVIVIIIVITGRSCLAATYIVYDYYPPYVAWDMYHDTEFAVSLSGSRYLCDIGTDRCEILHDGTYRNILCTHSHIIRRPTFHCR